jgi:predicted Zn-dependent peptidase
MLNRKQAPAIVDAVNYKLSLKPYTHYKLDNGIDVYSIDAGAEEVLQLEWVFSAGNTFEEKDLIAPTVNFLLKNGTVNKNAFQINEHFEYYGSYLNRSCFNETATLSLHCLSKHINELLPVIRELLTDATMPQDELSLYQQNMKQRLEVNLKKSDFVAGRLIDVSLFGEHHPYGKYSSAEKFDAIQREELQSFYKKYYQQGSYILFVAGKIPKDLPVLLNKYFGDLAQSKIETPVPAINPGHEKKLRINNDPTGVQGSIRIARPFPNRQHPDFKRVQVLNAVFGGFFGSRLMSNIREDKGYTYGIHSYLLNLQQHSAWMISTEAGKDVCEATIAEVYKEMEVLRNELIPADELLLVRNYLMGGLLGDLDGPFSIIARWKNIILNGQSENYFYDSIHTIKSITAEELRELAQTYLQPDAFYEMVVI